MEKQEKKVIPTKTKLSIERALIFAESFPEDVMSEITILRDYERKSNVDYIVGIIDRMTADNIIMSDGVLFPRKSVVISQCEFNFLNQQKQVLR